ncbi:MAG TPA: helix-turn-helix domain-containing protein [Micromonosporaceae bacterium]
MYAERPSRLPGAVVWRNAVPDGGVLGRVLPDGCLDLLWVDDTLLVAGPDTAAYVPGGRPGSVFVGVRFAPGAGAAIIGVPANELRDRRVPLADVWPAGRVRRLTTRMASAADPVVELERVAAERVAELGPPDAKIAAIVRGMRAGSSVARTAAVVGLTERALHRRCLAAFGYGPKTLARILRLNRAVALARGGTPFATVAAIAGYADQAHLARDVRALAGVPLGALTS